ncbi:MAG: hypothetical protein AAGK32_09495 [Actinomycetota bacterium]
MLDDPDVVAARQERDAHGDALVVAALDAIPGWVERGIRARAGDVDRVVELAAVAGAAAVADAEVSLVASVRRLPGVEAGPAPLQVLRSLVVHPTAALRELNVPVVARPAFERDAFPDDVYGLAPATWSDVDPALHDLGLAWGAATAFLHQRIRRAAPPS